jgi:hypothetical protein
MRGVFIAPISHQKLAMRSLPAVFLQSTVQSKTIGFKALRLFFWLFLTLSPAEPALEHTAVGSREEDQQKSAPA